MRVDYIGVSKTADPLPADSLQSMLVTNPECSVVRYMPTGIIGLRVDWTRQEAEWLFEGLKKVLKHD